MENINQFLYPNGYEYVPTYETFSTHPRTDSIEYWKDFHPKYRGINIKLFNNQPVYYIDGRRVIFDQIHGNFAKCTIISIDLTTYKAWLVKDFGFVAFGKTIKEAYNNVKLKSWQTIPLEERIQQFVDTHPLDKMFPNKELFEWHDILTGSCMVGKYQFCRKQNVDLSKETTTLDFLNLVKNHYKSDIIQQVLNKYKGS